jgi:hypothetical protein
LSDFRPPVDYRELSFLKACRFINVGLSKQGIKTAGHLWRLGKTIPGKIFSELPGESDAPGRLSPYRRQQRRRQRLRQLVGALRSGALRSRHEFLAHEIKIYLREDEDPNNDNFSKQYKDLMAEEVVEAMRVGKDLHLASLVCQGESKDVWSPYRGIFIDEPGEEREGERYAFTASRPASVEDEEDIHKHVSLEVEWQDPESKGPPRLITKKWINGLLFFDGCSRRNVVFPWPAALVT